MIFPGRQIEKNFLKKLNVEVLIDRDTSQLM